MIWWIRWKAAWLLRCRGSKPRNPISRWATNVVWNESRWDDSDNHIASPSPKAAEFLAKMTNLPDEEFDRTIAMIFRSED